jgi:integrase
LSIFGYEPHPKSGALRRKQKFITFRGTKRQAESKLAEIIRNLNHGEFVEPSKLTLRGWLKRWIETLAASPTPRKSTLARYRSIIACVNESTLANAPVQKLLPSSFAGYYNELAKDGLVPGTIRLHHAVLHRALQSALNDNLIFRNPTERVENRPTTPKDRSEHARVHCWTAEEARKFLAAADAAGLQPSAFYAIALDSGARLRELAGLCWTDIDLESGIVTIRRQLLPTTNEKPEWDQRRPAYSARLSSRPKPSRG